MGDGRAVKTWQDRWIPGSVNGRASTARPAGCQREYVHELIEGGKWKTNDLQCWFNVNDVENITSIPLAYMEEKIDCSGLIVNLGYTQ